MTLKRTFDLSFISISVYMTYYQKLVNKNIFLQSIQITQLQSSIVPLTIHFKLKKYRLKKKYHRKLFFSILCKPSAFGENNKDCDFPALH